MSVRVKCITLGCEQCSKAECAGKSETGEKLYTCKAYKIAHVSVKATLCPFFRCKQYREEDSQYCKNCRRGK